MPVLWIHDGYKKEFERKIDSYTDELESIQSQYNSAMSLISRYSGGDINSCNIYLKKRKTAISQAIGEAESLKSKANSYVSNVISTDQSISSSIHKQAYNFYEKKGIGPRSDSDLARAWNSFTTSVEDIWLDTTEFFSNVADDIKEFYEENKYLINIVLDALAVVGAILLFAVAGGTFFGIICTIGAIWALSKASYELVTDIMALDAHLEGDEARAEELSQRTLTADLIALGVSLDEKWGTHFMETVVKYGLIGLEVCEFVVTMVLVWESVRKIFNLNQLNSLNLNKCGFRSWKQNLNDLKMVKWLGTKTTPRLGSALNWTKFALFSVGFSIDKGASSWATLNSSLGGDNLVKNVELVNKIRKGAWVWNLNTFFKPAYGLADDIVVIILE